MVDGDLRVELDNSTEARRKAGEIIEVFRPAWKPEDANLPAAQLLWRALEPLGWVRALRALLNERVAGIDQVADTLFRQAGDLAERRKAAHRILEILAVARDEAGDIPLLPVRIHATARGPHGVYACINGACPEAVVPGALGKLHTEPVGRCACGCGVYELRVCDSCGQSFVLGGWGTSDAGVPAFLPNTAKGEARLYSWRDHWDDGGPLPTGVDGAPKRTRLRTDVAPCVEGAARELWEFPGGRLKGPTRQLVGVPCPRCSARRPLRPVIRRIESGSDAALQVLLDGVYPSLPRHRRAAQGWLRGEGRRLLLFADNRQIAAALAAKVEESHDMLLARRILVEALEASVGKGDSPEVATLKDAIADADDPVEVARLKAELATARARASVEGIGFERLVRAITDHVGRVELSNHDSASEPDLARMVIARELGRRPNRVGNLEANGVVVVEYGIPIPGPAHPDVRSLFGPDRWTALVSVLLDMLRMDGICKIPRTGRYDEFLPRKMLDRPLVRVPTSGYDDDDSDDDDGEPATDSVGRWYKTPVSLLPAGAGAHAASNRRVEYVDKVLKALAAPSSLSPGIVLEEVWSSIEALAPAGQQQSQSHSPIRRGEKDGQLELAFSMLRFRLSSAGPLFRCPRCRTYWARELAAICPTMSCEGSMDRVAHGSERDLRDRLVSRAVGPARVELYGLSSEEHTAQILPEDLEQFESRFKDGVVNAIVCSTTMELGIDIGGLSATLLTNVPPGPSNYLQRAGRTGRRAEGTALVLTFARPRPFDQAAFYEPASPFLQRITPPAVKLDSPRICERHVFAYLLACFFERFNATVDTPNPLGTLSSVGAFFDRAIDRLEHVEPSAVATIRDALGVDTSQQTMCHAFVAWIVDSASEDAKLAIEVGALVRGTILGASSLDALLERCWTQVDKIASGVSRQFAFLRDELQKELAKPEADQDLGLLAAVGYQEADLEKEPLLGFLAEEQFLPRYGFPVQVVRLNETWAKGERQAGDPDHPRLRLDRDVSLALSEYAPGAEVVAGKYVHVSRGLLRHWTGADAPGIFAWRFVAICSNCGRMQYARNQGEILKPCPLCHQADPREIPVLHPKHGFAVQWGTRPKRWAGATRTALRPVTEASYAAREGEPSADVCQGLALAYDEEGEILVRTEGSLVESDLSGARAGSSPSGAPREGFGYAICYLCGRAEPETSLPTMKNGLPSTPLPKGLANHRRLRGTNKCESKHQYWRHRALAGALRTETLRLELKGQLTLPSGDQGRRLATTWMVALQLAAGEVLGVDSREIGGLLTPRDHGGVVYDVILFDQVAGGVGHCRALLSRWNELIRAARARLSCPNPACTTACHRCLLAFETQRYEPLLRRQALLGFLDPGWALFESRIERDGIPVAPVFRGGVELREQLSRVPRSQITVVAGAIGPNAMADDGWLRWLLRHADGPGRLRVILGRLPDPTADDDRVVSLRLKLAMEGGKAELYAVHPDVAAQFHWPVSADVEEHVYFVDQSTETDALGPQWLGQDARVFRVREAAAEAPARAKVQDLLGKARRCIPADLEPEEPPQGVVVHIVPAKASAADATFTRWFRNAAGDPLHDRPLDKLLIVDPYLQTAWQVTLLEDVLQLFRRNGVRSVEVRTYAPLRDKENTGPGVYRTLTASEQRDRIGRAVGQSAWQPEADPTDRRAHRRYSEGRQPTEHVHGLARAWIGLHHPRPGRRTTRELHRRQGGRCVIGRAQFSISW